ncbi:hypothetical protein C8R45DRAFT_1108553 [Mycena sanguinolenta]|nr:hypothetical protein C8R45DRAFT_1108553 [Mycena sanguinolenta]
MRFAFIHGGGPSFPFVHPSPHDTTALRCRLSSIPFPPAFCACPSPFPLVVRPTPASLPLPHLNPPPLRGELCFHPSHPPPVCPAFLPAFSRPAPLSPCSPHALRCNLTLSGGFFTVFLPNPSFLPFHSRRPSLLHLHPLLAPLIALPLPSHSHPPLLVPRSPLLLSASLVIRLTTMRPFLPFIHPSLTLPSFPPPPLTSTSPRLSRYTLLAPSTRLRALRPFPPSHSLVWSLPLTLHVCPPLRPRCGATRVRPRFTSANASSTPSPSLPSFPFPPPPILTPRAHTRAHFFEPKDEPKWIPHARSTGTSCSTFSSIRPFHPFFQAEAVTPRWSSAIRIRSRNSVRIRSNHLPIPPWQKAHALHLLLVVLNTALFSALDIADGHVVELSKLTADTRA